MSLAKIAIEELDERMRDGEQITFVDTPPRETHPSSKVRLPNAVRVPADEAEKH